jgi:hypothetical protein
LEHLAYIDLSTLAGKSKDTNLVVELLLIASIEEHIEVDMLVDNLAGQ